MATTAEGTAVGKSIAGYTLTRRERIEHLGCSYLELTHERTGARHIHIDCPDDNNGFALVFRAGMYRAAGDDRLRGSGI